MNQFKDLQKVRGEIPGAKFDQPSLTPRICILRDMLVHMSWDGMEEFYRVDSGGVERGEALKTAQYDGPDFRKYVCMNCGVEFDGESEDSDEKMKSHIGHKNPSVMPFEFHLRGKET